MDINKISGFHIRPAERRDAALIVKYIKDLASFEDELDQSFSTFLGKNGIALVDLYIEPEMRSRGFGKAMLAYLAALAREQECGRLEWWCHDWNAPAIALYKKWGAFPIDNIRVYRLCGDALSQFR